MQVIWAIYYKSLTWIKVILGRIPLLNYLLGWPTGGKGRYKLPRSHLKHSYPRLLRRGTTCGHIDQTIQQSIIYLYMTILYAYTSLVILLSYEKRYGSIPHLCFFCFFSPPFNFSAWRTQKEDVCFVQSISPQRSDQSDTIKPSSPLITFVLGKIYHIYK